MLKKIRVGICLLMLIPVVAHTQSCYEQRLASSIKSYESGQYNAAVTQLVVARDCSDANKKILDDWLKKCDTKIEEQRRIAEAGIVLKGKTRAIVDSLKRIIAVRPKRGYEKGAEKSLLRYIKACNSLADYYRKENKLSAVVFYYKKVTDMTTGTDSDLGDGNIRAITEWEKTRRKLALLAKEKPDLIKDKDSVLSLVEDNGQITIDELEQFSDYFFGKDDFILKKGVLGDSVLFEYFLNPLFMNRSPRYGKGDLFLQLNLHKLAERLRKDTSYSLNVSVSAHKRHYQTDWEAEMLEKNVQDYLVDIQSIPLDKIWLDPDPFYTGKAVFNGIKVWRIEISISKN